MVIRRHDDLPRTLRSMALSAGIAAEEEPRCLPGFGQGGGDLLLHEFTDGKSVMADITVVVEQKDGVVEQAATTAYHATDQAEALKCRRYADLCQHLDLGFLPLAVEVDGADRKSVV